MITTKLDAVNHILLNCRYSKVAALGEVYEAELAESLLDTASTEVLVGPYDFNHITVTASPNTQGEIIAGSDWLSCDPVSPSIETLIIGSKLYNKKTASFKWDKPVVLDVQLKYAWNDLPEAAKLYIQAVATVRFCRTLIGSNELYRLLQEDESRMLKAFKDFDADQADYNVLKK